MSTGAGGKPPSGSQPGRPPAETPQRLVVRSGDNTSDAAVLGSNDTAVALDTRSGPGTVGNTAEQPAASSAATTAELLGTTLSGRYLVTRKVGQGGMGAVYEATHTLIGKRVAVKVLLEKYAQREAIVKRLKQEAQLASSVGNEHIIDITDFGETEDGRTFVVMEFLDGESLAECLSRETKLPEQRILRIVLQAASALAAAHDKGIVHRDIKPENLFLQRRKNDDFVKVVDFGISKSLRATGEEEEPTRLTQTGMVLGTPLYMSPEQARGDDELDHRVDIWALGVIMYETATGQVPFAGNNYLSVISQVLNEDPKPLRVLRPDLSEEFEAIVQKAMAKDRADRYASAGALLRDLTALLDDPTRSTERARITGPRRKAGQRRSGTKVVVWFAGVAVVVAAVVFTVTKLVGPPAPPAAANGSGSNLAVTPAVPKDAAVVVDVPPVPETEVIEVTIESQPPGATVFLDGTERGVTPFTAKVVKKNKEVSGVGQLANYNDAVFTFNPLELPASKKVTFKLKQPPKGTAVQHKPLKGAGKPDPVSNDKTGGELGGNPFSGGGNVPKK
ncbi:MAG: serine/threonine protein kinase [Kofleriaceae bacterium]